MLRDWLNKLQQICILESPHCIRYLITWGKMLNKLENFSSTKFQFGLSYK